MIRPSSSSLLRQTRGFESGQPARRHFRPDIQGLRAVAVLIVMVHHAGLPLSGGFVGVDIFFVVSGFVITELLLREIQMTGSVDLLRFFKRRIRRLAPALGLLVGAVSLASIFLFNPSTTVQESSLTGVSALLLGANVVIPLVTGDYFGSPESNLFTHTWSLSVEEQFYLLFPLLVILVVTISSRARRSLFAVIAALSLMSLTLAAIGSTGFTPDVFGGWFLLDFYSPVVRAWEFGVGALVSLGGTRLRRLSKGNLGWLAFLLGVVGLFLSATLISERTPFPGLPTLLPVLSTVLLLLAGRSQGSISHRVFSRPSLVAVGDWSYSLYLWHWPLVVVVNRMLPENFWSGLIAIGVAFLPAYLSFRFVETPFRLSQPGTRIARRRIPKILVFFVGVPIAISGMVSFLAGHVAERYQLDGRSDWPSAVAECHEINFHNLPAQQEFLSKAAGCWWNSDATGPPIFVFGDSVAGMYSGPIIDAAQETERPVFILTQRGCRPVAELEQDTKCSLYVKQYLRYLGTQSPGTVVFATTDSQIYGPESLQTTSESADSLVGKAQLLADVLENTVGEVHSIGHRAIIVQPIPAFREPAPPFNPRFCAITDFLYNRCGKTISFSDFQERQAPLREKISALGSATGVEVIDFADRYCSTDQCSTWRNGELVFSDSTHLNVEEAAKLGHTFKRFLIEG